jgi:hypothetical protein
MRRGTGNDAANSLQASFPPKKIEKEIYLPPLLFFCKPQASFFSWMISRPL